MKPQPDHHQKALEKARDCQANVMLWHGEWDDKLEAEWQACCKIGTPTVIVGVQGAEVPENLANHDIVVGTLTIDAEDPSELPLEEKTELAMLMSKAIEKAQADVDLSSDPEIDIITTDDEEEE